MTCYVGLNKERMMHDFINKIERRISIGVAMANFVVIDLIELAAAVDEKLPVFVIVEIQLLNIFDHFVHGCNINIIGR